jgi:hypothetical protein
MSSGAVYSEARATTCYQATFLSGDKTAAHAGKVVYVDGFHLQYDPATNVYYYTRPINSRMTRVQENYWIVTDNVTGVQTLWSPTAFTAAHT